MNKQRPILAPRTTNAPSMKKRPYSPPALTEYGTVSKLTMSNTGSSADGNSMNPGNFGSDRTLKTGIVQIGEHPTGLNLYLFDYKPEYRDTWGHGRQFGVMADEVEQVMPEAVSMHPEGYRMVNYGMLGIRQSAR